MDDHNNPSDAHERFAQMTTNTQKHEERKLIEAAETVMLGVTSFIIMFGILVVCVVAVYRAMF